MIKPNHIMMIDCPFKSFFSFSAKQVVIPLLTERDLVMMVLVFANNAIFFCSHSRNVSKLHFMLELLSQRNTAGEYTTTWAQTLRALLYNQLSLPPCVRRVILFRHWYHCMHKLQKSPRIGVGCDKQRHDIVKVIINYLDWYWKRLLNIGVLRKEHLMKFLKLQHAFGIRFNDDFLMTVICKIHIICYLGKLFSSSSSSSILLCSLSSLLCLVGCECSTLSLMGDRKSLGSKKKKWIIVIAEHLYNSAWCVWYSLKLASSKV